MRRRRERPAIQPWDTRRLEQEKHGSRLVSKAEEEAAEIVPETIHAVIFKDADSDQWVAVCLEIDVVTQGDSEEHAKEMIKEAVELHLEDMDKEDFEVLYQAIEGTPHIHEVTIRAPQLLHT